MKAKLSFFPLLCLVLLLALPPQLAYSQLRIEFCPVCNRPKQNCPYKMKHPKCKTCKKAKELCPYNGKHPKAEPVAPPVAEPEPEPEPEPIVPEGTITVNGVSFKMIQVEGGMFQMGSTTGGSEEQPVHQVALADFSIGETEVTQELWEAVMGSNPSNFKGSKRPVEKVSWNDCQTFIAKLNQLTDKTFRLPTEAEWEYAARGGNKSEGYTYSGSNTIDEVAWYWDNSSRTTHDVATKAPNELGIYDMTGNVWEWCQDWYGGYSSSSQTNPAGPPSGSNRVRRGGSWYYDTTNCRASIRSYYYPTFTYNYLGLRLAM